MNDERELLPGISVHFMVLNPPVDRFAALVAYLRPYVNEFVIVDTGSSESTVSKMRDWSTPQVPVRLIHEPFVNFADTRNKGLVQHRHEWTLVLDPDELPSMKMLAHVRYATSEQGVRAFPEANAWLYWTYNYWDGVLGPEMNYHWHTRLWKTRGSYMYRPVHELVVVCGEDELVIRGSNRLPMAPKDAFLIHSKAGEEIEKADKLYADMGEVSR